MNRAQLPGGRSIALAGAMARLLAAVDCFRFDYRRDSCRNHDLFQDRGGFGRLT
jgi:hypothetical protein